MDVLLQPLAIETLDSLQTVIEEWVFTIALALLACEFVRYAIKKKLSWTLAGDSLASYITLLFYLGVNATALAILYYAVYASVNTFTLFDFDVTWLSALLCIVLADFAYYWEHRFSHRVNMAWATHTVHHSSPHFNLSVAYRFGPLDALWTIPFHIPILLLGFDPLLVLFASVIVLEYQTFLHTEAITKFPKPIEFIFNTPSHHRVHHGTNTQYIDKNYGGIFIIWDRMFGTFAEEKEPVTYGLVNQINSNNPFVVWLHGLARLARKVWAAKGAGNKMRAFFGPPEWERP